MRKWFRVILPPALFALCSTPANAQRADGVLLSGTVLDDATAEPISGALVELLDRRGAIRSRVITGDDGTFVFTAPANVGYQFRASRIGYRRATTPKLYTDEHDLFQLEIRLDSEAVLLAPLEVTAWKRRTRPSSILEGFRDRMRSGLGYFFTREDIERRNPGLVSDIIGTVPGVELRSTGRGLRRHVYMSRTGDHCPAQIFVDGFLLNGTSRTTGDPDFTIDDAVPPSVVEAIEVYRGLSSVPAEFLNAHSRCGAVVVWTRRGG